MANAFRAGFHRMAHRALPVPVGSSDRVTRYRHFSAACSEGKWPRALIARRYRAFSDSIAFAERAHAAAPGFELTGGNAAAVAEICRRLDGLPLALELAAARVRLLPPQALASRLDERFSLLTGGARDLPQRQQTLRNTLDWSFGLLPAGEQALFARLGVFAGSFSLPAAEAVGAGSPAGGQAGRPGQVMDTLGALVDSSLVGPQTRSGEPRFSLLETIREYARDRLRGSGDWVQAHDRHAAYFLALAEPAAADLAGPGQLAWLDRLEAEHDNLRAAMSWLARHGPLEQAVHLSLATQRFWWLRGHAAELARLGDDLVAGSAGPAATSARAGAEPSRVHPRRQRRSGPGAAAAGADAAVVQAGQRNAAGVGDHERAGPGLSVPACGTRRRDDAAASKLRDQAQALLREPRDDDPTGFGRLRPLLTVAIADNALGQIRLGQGDNDAAAHLFTDALAAARRAQDRPALLTSLYDLALARQAQATWPARPDTCRTGSRWRPRPATKPAPPTIWRSWPPSPDSRTTRSVPYACSLPPARSCKPGAAAGCTPSCPASRTTIRSWPRCAPRSATRHSTRPRHGAGPPGANARWNTHSRKPDPPRPRSPPAGCSGAPAPDMTRRLGSPPQHHSPGPACRRLRSPETQQRTTTRSEHPDLCRTRSHGRTDNHAYRSAARRCGCDYRSSLCASGHRA